MGGRLPVESRAWANRWTLFAVVAGVVAGATVAPMAWQAATAEPGVVAVVPLEGAIDGESAQQTVEALERAAAAPEVEAVVLAVNSPGGTAAASERLYLRVSDVARRLPVVASVDAVAASGAYYAIVPSDRIYAKPSSIVGSVGVFAEVSSALEPTDDVAASGPEKLQGQDRRSQHYTVETIRRAFVGAVFRHRGDALTLSRNRVSHASIYVGPRAVRTGMVDRIGDRRAAVTRAASLAGLERYRTTVVRPNGTARFLTRAAYLASDAPEKRLVAPSYFAGEARGIPTYLMLPPGYAGPRQEVGDAPRP